VPSNVAQKRELDHPHTIRRDEQQRGRAWAQLHSSSLSHRTASLSGIFDFSHVLQGPLRYGASMRFETMPSRPMRHACANTRENPSDLNRFRIPKGVENLIQAACWMRRPARMAKPLSEDLRVQVIRWRHVTAGGGVTLTSGLRCIAPCVRARVDAACPTRRAGRPSRSCARSADRVDRPAPRAP
jgi:hypothetical protein